MRPVFLLKNQRTQGVLLFFIQESSGNFHDNSPPPWNRGVLSWRAHILINRKILSGVIELSSFRLGYRRTKRILRSKWSFIISPLQFSWQLLALYSRSSTCILSYNIENNWNFNGRCYLRNRVIFMLY